VTRILRAMRDGDDAAASQLFGMVYDELRALARGQLRRERSDHTLQPTALVHETWLRMLRGKPPDVNDRAHFIGVAAHAMRRLLIDHARAREAAKRGGSWQRVTLAEETSSAGDRSAVEVDLLALNQALERLEGLSERLVRVVELRFFGGMTVPEAAAVLGVAPVTVEKDWTKAKAWLRRELVAT